MITKQQYVEYSISTVGNYTGSHLAEHLDDVSHDTVSASFQRKCHAGILLRKRQLSQEDNHAWLD